MDNKKGTTVLVILALVLACTAIIINVALSQEVPTNSQEIKVGPGTGRVGLTVMRSEVEDKMKGVDLG